MSLPRVAVVGGDERAARAAWPNGLDIRFYQSRVNGGNGAVRSLEDAVRHGAFDVVLILTRWCGHGLWEMVQSARPAKTTVIAWPRGIGEASKELAKYAVAESATPKQEEMNLEPLRQKLDPSNIIPAKPVALVQSSPETEWITLSKAMSLAHGRSRKCIQQWGYKKKLDTKPTGKRGKRLYDRAAVEHLHATLRIVRHRKKKVAGWPRASSAALDAIGETVGVPRHQDDPDLAIALRYRKATVALSDLRRQYVELGDKIDTAQKEYDLARNALEGNE